MRLCQVVPFVSSAPAVVPSPRVRKANTLAANWDVVHRYTGNMFGNQLLDEGNPLFPDMTGAATGVVVGGGGLQFTGVAPCIRFDDSPLPGNGEYSIIARFTAPSTFVPFSSIIVWEDLRTRLFMATNETANAAALAFAYDGGKIVWGGDVGPSLDVSAAVVCGSGLCSIVR